MLVNVKKFSNLLKKATLNHSINTFHCDITPERIWSKMIRPSKDAIVCIDITNEVFKENNETLCFDFIEPNVSIVPYLNLVDTECAEILVRNEKLIIKNGKQKSNLFFCEPEIPSKFGASEPKFNFPPVITIDVNEDFLEPFSKIKKVGSKFGKIYFGVKKGVFSMETTDKTNKFSNGLEFDLADNIDHKDFSLCFDYGNITNMFGVLDNDISYDLKFIYIPEKDMGMLTCARTNKDAGEIENYYLMSKME